MKAVNTLPALVINSGSSSIKFAVYRNDELRLRGKLDGEALTAVDGSGKSLAQERMKLDDREQAIQALAAWLKTTGETGKLVGIGYRIVHGGRKYTEPARIDGELMEELRRVAPLAPDHVPDQISTIERMQAALPGTPGVACFDTAFHRTMPRKAQVYGLNQELEREGVVKYGFHGISYSYIVGAMRERGILPEKLIVAHLGNGASMAAILDGRSVDTSMGLTPTGGFAMSNRSGDMDPGVVLHLLREKKMTVEQVADLVNKQGGLKGISGASADMRELEKRSPETVALFCYGVKKFLGAYWAALEGLDALVFTGGVGENSAGVRAGICGGLERLGILLDEERNRASAEVISKEGSPVTVRVMKTNEELVIAREVRKALG